MAQTRRYPSPWVLLFTVAAALALHVGAVGVYALLRPVPPPQLVIHFEGRGSGVVQSRPAGLSCDRGCAASFPPGTEIELVATPADGSTFAGWSEHCHPRADHVLACTLTLVESTRVHVEFGLVPAEVEVAWVHIDETPEDRDAPLTVALPDPEIEAELLVEPLAELLAEVRPELLPEPEPQPEPLPAPPPAPPAPPPPEMANLRSVEVPDGNEVEEAPDDATHLSDKNRNVAEETHATETNLQREQAGDQVASAESSLQSDEIGGEEAAIAELEDSEPTTLDDQRIEESVRTGDSDRAVGQVVGEAGEGGEEGKQGDDTDDSRTPGMLSMRDIEGRGALLPEPGQGGKSGALGRTGQPGVKTQLDFEDYERIVGKDRAEEEVALGRQKRSTRQGRWEKKLGAVQSALENFTPEVRPGNQTELKTRAAPFAVYLARMHRKIHPLWAFGFLEDLNDKPASHPLNDWNLTTTLEIVLEPDGTVHKTNIVRHSGRLEFDVAAIDVILTAAPFEPSPEQIRSPDGRVYMHWGFYRDHRQCGTFNAQPFILAEAPAGSDAASEGSALDDGKLVRNLPRRTRAAGPEGDSGAGQEPGAPRVGSRGADDPLSPENAQALHAANLWITGFAHGNVARMLSVSGTPFRSGTAFVASSDSEIAPVYRTVLAETRGRVSDWRLLTPATYRQRFGALPAGVDPARPQLLVALLAGRERITLTIEPQGGGDYKITGLYR